MLPTFVIGLREGVEAALIVGIIAAFLRKEGRARRAAPDVARRRRRDRALRRRRRRCWRSLNQELPQRQQEGLETIIGVAAVGDRHLHDRLDAPPRPRPLGRAAAQRGRRRWPPARPRALVGMAFFAVIREGLETVVFLLAVLPERRRTRRRPASARCSACCARWRSASLIYRGGVKLNLARFFRITGVVLVLVAAGLVASALHTAHEAGWLNAGQAPGARPQLAGRARHVDLRAADRHARLAAAADRRRGDRLLRSTCPVPCSTCCWPGRGVRARARHGSPQVAGVASLLLLVVVVLAASRAAARRRHRAPRAGGKQRRRSSSPTPAATRRS